MPEHPIIPPIDPVFIAEVHELTRDAQALLRILVAPLSERIGRLIEKMDLLQEAVYYDDDSIDEIRTVTGYDDLIATMGIIASYAGAAADEPTTSFADPNWYIQLREKRRERWARKVA